MAIVSFSMRDRSSPWKWPICIGLAFGLVFAAVFLIPQDWIQAFFSPLSLAERFERQQGQKWLVLLPPPAVQMVPDKEPVPRPLPEDQSRLRSHLDPDWWTKGWRIRPVTDQADEVRQAVQDSVAILLKALGVERDFMTRARPDSVLASRLFLLKVADSFKFEEMKPYLSALARSQDYRDMMSRKADMYDDFLRTEIMTPD